MLQAKKLSAYPHIYSNFTLGASGLYIANLLYLFDNTFVISLAYFDFFPLVFAMLGGITLSQGCYRLIQSMQVQGQLIGKMSQQDLRSKVSQHAKLYQTRKSLTSAPSSTSISKVAILLIAIDKFDSIEKELGINAAQFVQLSLSQIVTENIRQQDWLSPLEPGWLLVYLPNMALTDVNLKAQHLRLLVTDEFIHFSGQPLRITLSIAYGEIAEQALADVVTAAKSQILSDCAQGNKVVPISL
ncbi:GGDEF domain-containing protein [Shewanella sp. SNU WT4]|uniref:diguanylate cyclase domain-containing protein n=1 Tax=Shewanella sp. SNU WT4 TaxID=2590015 RepID=UPI0011267C72|nr:diguanylate cyclase [Shewanella sp. SNU WT4]QDF66512.1 GGDEF domain-containing protein [Shewanella sp. SNU WT4]